MEEISPASKRPIDNGADSDEPPPKRVKEMVKHFEKLSSEDSNVKKVPPPSNGKDGNSDHNKIPPAVTGNISIQKSININETSAALSATLHEEQDIDEELIPPKQNDTTSTIQSTPPLLEPKSMAASIVNTADIDDSVGENNLHSERKVRFSSQNDTKLITPRNEIQVSVPSPSSPFRKSIRDSSIINRILVLMVFCVIVASAFLNNVSPSRMEQATSGAASDVTLRHFLSDPAGFHLAMAPAFFGFYGYFGSLAAWDEQISNSTFSIFQDNVNSVAGASAGAMAAVLLAAGVPPREAADFCSTITLPEFADFPGLLTVFRGNKFQEIMARFLKEQKPNSTLQLQDAEIPVAVSGFDLQTMKGKLLSRGNMARAARASACFPFLFQPVGWIDGNDNYLLIDGGLKDMAGLMGLGAFEPLSRDKRVVNLVVGDFLGSAPGPSSMPEGVHAKEVLSISLRNLPQCGPHVMENGPRAVAIAIRAMTAALDWPLMQGQEDGHFLLPIDASSFSPTS